MEEISRQGSRRVGGLALAVPGLSMPNVRRRPAPCMRVGRD